MFLLYLQNGALKIEAALQQVTQLSGSAAWINYRHICLYSTEYTKHREFLQTCSPEFVVIYFMSTSEYDPEIIPRILECLKITQSGLNHLELMFITDQTPIIQSTSDYPLKLIIEARSLKIMDLILQKHKMSLEFWKYVFENLWMELLESHLGLWSVNNFQENLSEWMKKANWNEFRTYVLDSIRKMKLGISDLMSLVPIFPELDQWQHLSETARKILGFTHPLQLYYLGYPSNITQLTDESLKYKLHEMENLDVFISKIQSQYLDSVNQHDSLGEEIKNYFPQDRLEICSTQHRYVFTRPEIETLLEKKINFWTGAPLNSMELQLVKNYRGLTKHLPPAKPMTEAFQNLDDGWEDEPEIRTISMSELLSNIFQFQ